VVVSLSAGMLEWAVLSSDSLMSTAQAALILYGLYHAGFYWLMDGQTPGLASLEIRLVSDSGNALLWPQAILRGALRPALVAALAVAAWQGEDKAGLATSIAFAPLLAELGMMFTLPGHQTLSDLAARTLAVEAQPPATEPPPQVQPAPEVEAKLGAR
jgi:uncharacterized RDD family membrane protein YckC